MKQRSDDVAFKLADVCYLGGAISDRPELASLTSRHAAPPAARLAAPPAEAQRSYETPPVDTEEVRRSYARAAFKARRAAREARP
jgi:hypothetical protein